MKLTPRSFHFNGNLMYAFEVHCNGICGKDKKPDKIELFCEKHDVDYCTECMNAWRKDNSLFEIDDHCLSLVEPTLFMDELPLSMLHVEPWVKPNCE